MAIREQAALEVLVGGRYGGMSGMGRFENDLNRISSGFQRTFADPWKSPAGVIGDQFARSQAAAEKATTARRDAELAQQKVTTGGLQISSQYQQQLAREAAATTDVEKAQRRLANARYAEQNAMNAALSAPTATRANQFTATRRREERQLAEADLANTKMRASAQSQLTDSYRQNLPVQNAMLEQTAAKRLKYAQDMETAAKKEELAAQRFQSHMNAQTRIGRVNSVANGGLLVGGSIVGAGIYTGLQAANWQGQIATVGANTNMSQAEQKWLAQHGAGLLGMGANEQQILAAYRYAKQSGYSYGGALSLTRQVLKSAIPTGADPGMLMFTVTSLLKQFGYDGRMGVKMARPMTDYIHTAAALGNMNVEQFSNNFGQVGAFATQAHNPEVMLQAMALFSAMTQMHIPYAQASTQVRGFLQQVMMPRPTSQKILDQLRNQGNPLYKDFSAQGLSERGIGGLLTDLRRSHLTNQEMRVLFPNMRGILTAFLGTSPEGMKVFERTNAGIHNAPTMFGGKGATQGEYDIWSQNPQGQMKKFEGSVKQLEIALGQGLLPVMVSVAKAMIPIVHNMADWTNHHKALVSWIGKMGLGLLAVSAAVRGFTFLFGPLIHLFIEGEGRFGLFSKVLGYVSSGLELLGLKSKMVTTETGLLDAKANGLFDRFRTGTPVVEETANRLRATGQMAAEAGTEAETAGTRWGGMNDKLIATKDAAMVADGSLAGTEAAANGLIGTSGAVTVGEEGALAGTAGTGLLGVVGALAAILIGAKLAGDALSSMTNQGGLNKYGSKFKMGDGTTPNLMFKNGEGFVYNTGTGYFQAPKTGDIMLPNGQVVKKGTPRYRQIVNGRDTGSANFGPPQYIVPGQSVPTGAVFGIKGAGTPYNEITNPNYPGGRAGAIAMAGVPNATVHSDIPVPVGTAVRLPGGKNARYQLVRTGYDHDGGYFETWRTPNGGLITFFHLSNNKPSKGAFDGQWYSGGSVVARSGDTGANTSGPHLHVGMNAKSESYVYGQTYGQGWIGNPYKSQPGNLKWFGSEGKYAQLFMQAAAGGHIDPAVLAAIGMTENSGNPNFMGVMGVGHAASLQIPASAKHFRGNLNWAGGQQAMIAKNRSKIDWVLQQAGITPTPNMEALVLALAAYNAGPAGRNLTSFAPAGVNPDGYGLSYALKTLKYAVTANHGTPAAWWTGQGPTAYSKGSQPNGTYGTGSIAPGVGPGNAASASHWGQNKYGAYPNEVDPATGLPYKPGKNGMTNSRYWYLMAQMQQQQFKATFPDSQSWKWLNKPGIKRYEQMQGSVYYDQEQQKIAQIQAWWGSLSAAQQRDKGFQAAYHLQLGQAKRTYGQRMNTMHSDVALQPMFQHAFWMKSNYQNLHNEFGLETHPWTLSAKGQKQWLQGQRSMDWYWAQYEATEAKIYAKQHKGQKGIAKWLADKLHSIWAAQHQKDANAMYKLTHHGQLGASGRVTPVHVVGHCAAEAAANTHRKKSGDGATKTAKNTESLVKVSEKHLLKLEDIVKAIDDLKETLGKGHTTLPGPTRPIDPRYRGNAHKPRPV